MTKNASRRSPRRVMNQKGSAGIKDVDSLQGPAKGQALIRGGTTSGSPGQLVRFWNRWRENYNALVGLTIARVRALNEMTQRGDHAYPQWTYRTIERRHPVLIGLIECCQSPLENFKWDVRIKKELPAGFDEDDAAAQQEALKAAYAQIDNMKEAIAHTAHAFFRGYGHLQKHRQDGEVTHLEPLFTYCLCRDGLFGDWFWNPDSRSLTQPEYVLTNANRIGGEQLPREDFIILEVERPIDEVALENYVRRKLIEKDWSAFDEIFGIPSGVITMPPNIPPGQESAYEAAAKGVAEGGNGAIPNGATYQPNDAPRDGSNLFKNHISQLDEDLVLAGTGGKLTMLVQAGAGDKRGDAGVQANVFQQIMQRRGNKVAEAFHRDFDIPFLLQTFPLQPALVEFCLVTEDEVDVQSLCTNAATLKTAGKNVSTDWLAQQTGYEFEDDDEPAANFLPGQPGTPDDFNPLQNRRRRLRNRTASEDVADTLRTMLLPVIKRLQAIAGVPDPALQRDMIQKLLADYPQITAAIQADDSLAKQLSPLLQKELLAGLQIQNRAAHGPRVLNFDEDQPRDELGKWTDDGAADAVIAHAEKLAAGHDINTSKSMDTRGMSEIGKHTFGKINDYATFKSGKEQASEHMRHAANKILDISARKSTPAHLRTKLEAHFEKIEAAHLRITGKDL